MCTPCIFLERPKCPAVRLGSDLWLVLTGCLLSRSARSVLVAIRRSYYLNNHVSSLSRPLFVFVDRADGWVALYKSESCTLPLRIIGRVLLMR
ncbi:hypothetical protein BD414DRAFT_581545 [Trametes punicea]|nr:hypothetical protein BD414DRAFT_581545 [Trametes punicea]